MSTKINQNYYGDSTQWVEVYGNGITGNVKVSNRNIYNLCDGNYYQGGNFDLTASPWGIGESSLSSDFYCYALSDNGRLSIQKYFNKKGNSPLFLYKNSSGTNAMDLRSGELSSDDVFKYTARTRINPAVDVVNSTTVNSTLDIDNGTNIDSNGCASAVPVTYYNYNKSRLLCNVFWYRNASDGVNKVRNANVIDLIVNPQNYENIAEVYGMTLEGRFVYGTQGEVPKSGQWVDFCPSIGGCQQDIPDFIKKSYYGENYAKWTRPQRKLMTIGYWRISDRWATSRIDYSSGIPRDITLYEAPSTSAYYYPTMQFYGQFSEKHQVFDDVSYHWELKYAWATSASGTPIYLNEGDIIPPNGYYMPYCTLVIDDTTYNTIAESYFYALIHEAAFMGFPVIANRYDSTYDIPTDQIFLPVFDDHMITTGDFKRGSASLELPNATWGDIFDNNMPDYDPEYQPPKPDEDDNEDEGIKVRPSTPGFTLAGRGTECYELIESDIDEIFDDIYGRNTKSWNKLIKGLQMFGSDPMGAIISFKWYPFSFTPGTSKAVYLGNTAVNPLHQYPTIEGTSNSYISTTATFKWDKPKNFVNSRHTKCRIYLPFYGFYELPISMMISKTLSVYMAYNVPDETAVWILSFDDVIYDFCECDPSIEIPLTGSNAGQIALVKRQAALSIAASIGAAATAVTVAASTGLGPWISAFSESGYGVGAAIAGAWGNIGSYGELARTFGLTPITAAGAGAAAMSTYNTIQNAKVEIATLQTNLPHHGAASATTFLNLPMYPYIQFIQNIKMQGYNEEQYKLKVGHACDIWTTMTNMPENSLLQTTGMADMSSMSMELNEITELNSILQTGFYR